MEEKGGVVVKVQFVWSHWPRHGFTARRLVELLNGHRPFGKEWKGWVFNTGSRRRLQETVQIELKTLRGRSINDMMLQIEEMIGQNCEIRIDGRFLLNYAVWADDQIRRLKKKLKEA